MDVFAQLLAFLSRTLAGYLLGAGQVIPARRTAEWGLRYVPGSADLWALRGRILLHAVAVGPRRRGDAAELLEEARAAYARALELRPDDSELRREHGLVLQNLAWVLALSTDGRARPDLLVTAAGEYTRVLERQPRRADVLHERAMARAGMRAGLADAEARGWLDAARADLDRSLELRPHAAEVVLHRAEVLADLAGIHARAGRRAEELQLRRAALADCTRALKLRPGWPPLLLRQAMEATALARLGDDPLERTDLAIAAAAAVLRDHPRQVPAMLARADARVAAACRLCARGDARAAMVWRQAATDIDAAADTAGVRGREEILALRASARAEWAEAQDRAGDGRVAVAAWEESLAEYDRAVDDDPTEVRRLTGRAQVLSRLADRTADPDRTAQFRRRALEDFGQVLALHADDAAALAGRVDVRCRLGAEEAELRAAVDEAERAHGLHPEHGQVRTALRRALIALAAALGDGTEREGTLSAAERECAQALASDADDPAVHYDHARILFLRGQAAAAYAALEQAIHLAPGMRDTARRDPIWAPVAGGAGFRRLVGG